MPVQLLVSDKQPDAGKEVRDEAELDNQVEHFVDFVKLLFLDTAVKHFDNKLVEVFLVNTKFEQFKIPKKDVLGVVDRVRDDSYHV